MGFFLLNKINEILLVLLGLSMIHTGILSTFFSPINPLRNALVHSNSNSDQTSMSMSNLAISFGFILPVGELIFFYFKRWETKVNFITQMVRIFIKRKMSQFLKPTHFNAQFGGLLINIKFKTKSKMI